MFLPLPAGHAPLSQAALRSWALLGLGSDAPAIIHDHTSLPRTYRSQVTSETIDRLPRPTSNKLPVSRLFPPATIGARCRRRLRSQGPDPVGMFIQRAFEETAQAMYHKNPQEPTSPALRVRGMGSALLSASGMLLHSRQAEGMWAPENVSELEPVEQVRDSRKCSMSRGHSCIVRRLVQALKINMKHPVYIGDAYDVLRHGLRRRRRSE